MTYVLECKGLEKRFGDFLAIQGIDLSVRSGEFVGIIGANGAGKTTLLNIVSGYLTPSAGQILFKGEDVTGVPPRILVRRGIARSFQIPQLFPRSTVIENMMIARSLLAESQSSLMKRFDDDRLARSAMEIIDSYGLGQFAHAAVGKVPQGVRKLLDIAMAACAKPTLVLLDEPTSGVSSEEKNALMGQLAYRFKSVSTTVIFIEHDMEIVRTYASRVIALYDGKVIANGPAEKVFSEEQVISLITGRPATSVKELSHAPA